jgi:hypothetical protein
MSIKDALAALQAKYDEELARKAEKPFDEQVLLSLAHPRTRNLVLAAARHQTITGAQGCAACALFQAHQDRQERAREAYYSGQVAPKPSRLDNPAPEPQIRWVRPTTTDHLRDTRLTAGARLALNIIVGLVGAVTEREISVGGLANSLGVTIRTARRYLAELANPSLDGGAYIERREVKNARGWTVAGAIRLLRDLRPAFIRTREAKKRRNLARTVLSSFNPLSLSRQGKEPPKKAESVPRSAALRAGAAGQSNLSSAVPLPTLI